MMGPVTGAIVFLLIWWLVFFCVLPWGNQAPDQPETGHATSAPAKPRLKLKFAITTGIAVVAFAIIYVLAATGNLNFRPY